MVHPSYERSQISEHSFDLRGQFKFPASVDVRPVRDGPPGVDASVEASSIRLHSALWLHEFIQELAGLRLADCLAGEEAKGDPRGSDLLRHHERDVLEVRLVHLHCTAQGDF